MTDLLIFAAGMLFGALVLLGWALCVAAELVDDKAFAAAEGEAAA